MKKRAWRNYALIPILAMQLSVGFISCCKKCTNINRSVSRNLLTPDLVVIAISDKRLACPTTYQGDSVLGNIDLATTTDNGYQPSLPDQALFSMFFLQDQYDRCKDIFTDPFFIQALVDVPEPDSNDLSWFEKRRIYNTSFLPLDSTVEVNLQHIDIIQRKMIKVFHSILAWYFIPQVNSSRDFIIYGQYDDRSHTIRMYKNSCLAGKIYGSNIGSAALAHRFFFIGGHELGHAIDNLRGKLDRSTQQMLEQSELRANVYGLILTKGVCRLMNGMTSSYMDAVNKNKNIIRPCDSIYVQGIVQRWQNIESLFTSLIGEAKDNLTTNKKVNTLLSAYGCIETIK